MHETPSLKMNIIKNKKLKRFKPLYKVVNCIK